MSFEDRIRGALHADADGAQPTAGAWRSVRRAAAARRRHRRLFAYPMAAVLVVATVAGAAVAVAAVRDGDGSGGSVTATGQQGRPKQIAVIVDEKVVVLSSKNGKVVRTLVEGPDAAGASSIAVSGDGELVYFTRDDPDALCGEAPADQIATVPIDGGPVEIYASGIEPVASPDGRWFAYMTGGPDQCASPNLLAIEALGTGEFSQELIPLRGETTYPLAWSPDSQRLLYQDGRELREVTPGTGAPPRVLRNEAPLPATYLASGEIAVVADVEGNAVVRALDPRTDETRTLFRDGDVSVLGLKSDPSGRHLLLWTRPVVGTDSLERWSGRGKPEEFYRGNPLDFAWVPAAAAVSDSG